MDHKDIIKKLMDNGYEAYYVGGCVRDKLLKVPTTDYDITTNATPEEVKKIFGKTTTCGNTFLVSLVDGIEVATYRLDKGDHACHANNLKDDVIRRDFTINGLAMDINQQIIDHVGGVADMENRVLRFIGNPEKRIEEDPIRILRGIRFMAKYNLRAEINTHFAILKLANRVLTIPVERIQKEIIKAFQGNTAYYFVKLLDEYELLSFIFPSIAKLKILPGGTHHNETVFTHCLNALKSIDLPNKSYQLKLAALYHDTGKYDTQAFDIYMNPTFYDHEKASVEHAHSDFTRLLFSTKDVKHIENICAVHMLGILNEDKTQVLRKRLKKVMVELTEKELTLKEFLYMRYADNHSNILKVKPFSNIIWQYKQCLKILKEKPPFTIKDLKVSGIDIIGLGIPQGPEIGEILNRLFALVITEQIANERSTQLHYIEQYRR